MTSNPNKINLTLYMRVTNIQLHKKTNYQKTTMYVKS